MPCHPAQTTAAATCYTLHFTAVMNNAVMVVTQQQSVQHSISQMKQLRVSKYHISYNKQLSNFNCLSQNVNIHGDHSPDNDKSFNVAGAEIPLADHVKILGTILDSRLMMDNHTKADFKSWFYHIRSFRQIRSFLDDNTALLLLLP